MKPILVVWLVWAVLPVQMVAQTVRGTVRDAVTGLPLAYATVAVIEQRAATMGGDTLVVGTITDTMGAFAIRGITSGRYSIEARCIGYASQRKVDVLIQAHREAIADFELIEQITELSAITITATVDKSHPINPTVLAGAQMISIDEADRFAGTYEDIGRVVKRYAGSTGSTDNGGISTHGNPPSSTMYMLEGVEITPTYILRA